MYELSNGENIFPIRKPIHNYYLTSIDTFSRSHTVTVMYELSNGENIFELRWPSSEGQGQTLKT